MTLTMPSGTNPNIRKGISFGEIVSIMRQRRSQDSLLITQMVDARDRYNGDVVLPVPDVDGSPEMDPPVPRLIAQAIDGISMKAASPAATIMCPAQGNTQRAFKEADLRRRVLYAKWRGSQVPIKLYRSYRHLVGYGTCAWVAMPHDNSRTARLELRDPLTAFPELRAPDDIREPRNVGFIFGRSIDWITNHWPNTASFFANSAGRDWDTLWDVVEWIDEDEIVVGIMGPRMPAFAPQDARPYGYSAFELARWVNKAGCVPAVVPRRVTLDRIMGQMSTLTGMVDLHTRMTALMILNAEKHVFGDLAILSEPNMTAQVNGGQWKDGRTGEINVLQNARGVQYLTPPMNPAIPQTVAGLEDSIRESGGASGMFGGTNDPHLRTGAALAQMGSFSIDPRVEEVQRIQEQALQVANEHLIAVERGYYPRTKHFSFTGLQGEDAMVEYSPSDLVSGANVVSYPIPGADVAQMTVAVAQLDGAGLISKHTARVKHPFIDDANLEERMIQIEQLVKAELDGISTQAAQGAIPPVDLARIIQLTRTGTELQDAVIRAHEEAQKRQATQAPPPDESQGQVASPAAQPGLGMPGMGAEQPQGQPPPGPPGQTGPDLAGLHGLLRSLSQAPPQPALNGPPQT